MRWRVTILARTQAGSNELGEPVYEFAALRTAWAEKISRSEDEPFGDDQTHVRRLVTFRMWWAPDLTEVDRLECDGETFEITGIRELGFREGTEVAARLLR
jgi:head-tail adaptor